PGCAFELGKVVESWERWRVMWRKAGKWSSGGEGHHKVASPSRQEEGSDYGASIRDALHLADAEGIECLPNEEIFAELVKMSEPYGMSLVHQWDMLSSASPQVVKGFSRVETLLFEGMIVEQQVVKGDDDEVRVEDVNAVGVVTKGVVNAADDMVP
nr:hypothetical protein [Tanacetum cinerariifolium]